MARLLGVDLPRNKKMRIALRAIYGVGPIVAFEVLAKVGIDGDRSSNEITEEEVQVFVLLLMNIQLKVIFVVKSLLILNV